MMKLRISEHAKMTVPQLWSFAFHLHVTASTLDPVGIGDTDLGMPTGPCLAHFGPLKRANTGQLGACLGTQAATDRRKGGIQGPRVRGPHVDGTTKG